MFKTLFILCLLLICLSYNTRMVQSGPVYKNKTSNLNEEELSFLFANSIASRGDGLSLINHPEKSQELNHLVVDKPSSNLKLIGTYGSKVCSLTKTDKFESEVKICPWHYEIEHRSDRYPRTRLNAKCNCEDCLAKTVFDNKDENYSYCKPVGILMPVLIRKYDGNWIFALENVDTACVCTINLTPF